MGLSSAEQLQKASLSLVLFISLWGFLPDLIILIYSKKKNHTLQAGQT